jgi:hypothetical protein
MREIKLQDVVAVTKVGAVYTATVVRAPGTFETGASAEAAVGHLCVDHPEVIGLLFGADEVPVN